MVANIMMKILITGVYYRHSIFLCSLVFCTVGCRENPAATPESPTKPSASQNPPKYAPIDTRPTFEDILHRFEQSEKYSRPEKKSTLEWRQMRPLPNIQFELPAKIEFEEKYAFLNQETNSKSLPPLTLKRYSYIDLSLKKFLQKHPEQQGSEASTASIYFEIIQKLTLKEYIRRRFAEYQLFSPEVKRVSEPRKGFYVKWSDMFTYIHELWLENEDGIYRFEASEPNGSIPKESHLTEADILHIIFSLKISN
jgi:hypothetical protein